MKLYICAGRVFHTLQEASAHASWLFKVSGLIVAIESLEKGDV